MQCDENNTTRHTTRLSGPVTFFSHNPHGATSSQRRFSPPSHRRRRCALWRGAEEAMELGSTAGETHPDFGIDPVAISASHERECASPQPQEIERAKTADFGRRRKRNFQSGWYCRRTESPSTKANGNGRCGTEGVVMFPGQARLPIAITPPTSHPPPGVHLSPSLPSRAAARPITGTLHFRSRADQIATRSQ